MWLSDAGRMTNTNFERRKWKGMGKQIQAEEGAAAAEQHKNASDEKLLREGCGQTQKE